MHPIITAALVQEHRATLLDQAARSRRASDARRDLGKTTSRGSGRRLSWHRAAEATRPGDTAPIPAIATGCATAS